MSPSEFDLRSALHAGEGERLDVDRIVAGGRAVRARRRAAALTAVAVIVVGGGITGGGLAGGDDTVTGHAEHPFGTTSGAAPTGESRPNVGGARPTGASGPPQAPAPTRASSSSPGNSSRSGPSCPPSFPVVVPPSSAASNGPLFETPVAGIVICAYTSASSTAPTPRLVLTGTDARSLQASLESAPRTDDPASPNCPTVAPNGALRLAFIGYGTDGALKPVVTVLRKTECRSQVTNGTAVRYWRPPGGLGTKLHALPTSSPGVTRIPPSSAPGGNDGSPPR